MIEVVVMDTAALDIEPLKAPLPTSSVNVSVMGRNIARRDLIFGTPRFRGVILIFCIFIGPRTGAGRRGGGSRVEVTMIVAILEVPRSKLFLVRAA